MIILSRMAGESILIGSADDACLMTVLKIRPHKMIEVLVSRAEAARPGRLAARTVELSASMSIPLSETSQAELVDIRGDKVRIKITAAEGSSVHRLEVYEAILKDQGQRGNDPEEGAGGSRVPRPSPKKPPTLDSRRERPAADDDK